VLLMAAMLGGLPRHVRHSSLWCMLHRMLRRTTGAVPGSIVVVPHADAILLLQHSTRQPQCRFRCALAMHVSMRSARLAIYCFVAEHH
jgi:hypothetical protein